MENPVILIGLVVLAIVPYLLLLRIHALLAEIVKIMRAAAEKPQQPQQHAAPPTPAGRSVWMVR